MAGSRCELLSSCQPCHRRGLAKPGKNGAVKVLLDDYPYAEDGLLIWNALRKWNDGYLVRCTPGVRKVAGCRVP